MKPIKRDTKKTAVSREKILKSLIASFKIEGINISNSAAQKALKKVEISLRK